MAVPYFGDFDEDATVYIPFNTFDSNDPSASVTVTDLADADIKVHKDGAVAQIVTDGATVAINFDGITGNHLITVDTSVHADYATGSDYLVRLEGITVDGATLNVWVGSFSIQNRHSAGALRPTTAGRTLDVTAGGAAGIDWGNVENPTTAVDLSSTDIQLCDTVTTLTGHTAQTGDSFARIGVAGAGLTNINLPNQTMDIVGNITGNLSGSVGSVTGAVGSVAGNVDGNVTGTVGTVNALAAGSITATAIATDAIDADALAASAVTEIRSVNGTSYAIDTGGTTTLIDAALTEADDYWNGHWLLFTSGAAAGQVRLVTDFVAASDTLTYTPATPTTSAADTYEILPANGVDLRLWVGTAPNALVAGAIDADVSAMQAGTVTAAAIATGAVDADALASDAVNEIRDSILSDATTFAGANIDAAVSSRLAPTVAARTLDVAATGEAGVDFGNVTGTLTNANVAAFDANERVDVGAWLGTAATSGTGGPDVNVNAINDSTTAAVQLALSANQIENGACEGTPSTTVIQTDLAETQDDIYIGRTVIFTSGNARGEASDITDYAGATGTITVTALANAPAAADTFILI